MSDMTFYLSPASLGGEQAPHCPAEKSVTLNRTAFRNIHFLSKKLDMKLSRRGDQSIYLPSKASYATSMTFSLNGRLAVSNKEAHISIYDTTQQSIDSMREAKFIAKAKKAGTKVMVNALNFSPRDLRFVAVAQSDGLLVIYNVGSKKGDAKSVAKRFHQASSVEAMTWPAATPDHIYVGLADGKVKEFSPFADATQGKTSRTLYETVSGAPLASVLHVAPSPDGSTIYSAHADGTIIRHDLINGQTARLGTHHTTPSVLTVTADRRVAVCGFDAKLTMYTAPGAAPTTIDVGLEGFISGCGSPSGKQIVLCARDRVVWLTMGAGGWAVAGKLDCDNLYEVTAASFSQDGAALALATAAGVVELFDVCTKRQIINGRFEVSYIAENRVTIKDLDTAVSIEVSTTGRELVDLQLRNNAFVTAFGAGSQPSLVVVDLTTGLKVEVPWTHTRRERFLLDTPGLAMVFVPDGASTPPVGKLHVLPLTTGTMVGPVTAPLLNTYLISARLSIIDGEEQAFVAHIVDSTATEVIVHNLTTGIEHTRHQHRARIQWLELNQSSSHVLVKDARGAVWALPVVTDLMVETQATQMASGASYVQWVPGTDVVVAQCGATLRTWYSISSPDASTLTELEPDAEVLDIVRDADSTVVVVQSAGRTYNVPLDETLIRFNAALSSGDLSGAADALRGHQPVPPHIKGMWTRLAEHAIEARDLPVAIEAFKVTNVVSSTHYLSTIQAEVEAFEGGEVDRLALIDARLALMTAEGVAHGAQQLVRLGLQDSAIEVLTTLGKFEDAIQLANSVGKPEDAIADLKQQYIDRLMSTGQAVRVGQLREADGAFIDAISSYLAGGAPHRAADLITSGKTDSLGRDALRSLVDQVRGKLTERAMFKELGKFSSAQGLYTDAMAAFRSGEHYEEAIALAERTPTLLPELDDLRRGYGQKLLRQGHAAAAMGQFERAHAYDLAADAAINAGHFNKAENLLMTTRISDDMAQLLNARLAEHHHHSGRHAQAERLFLAAGRPEMAVNMWAEANDVDNAVRVARQRMSDAEGKAMLRNLADAKEDSKELAVAERLFRAIDSPSDAADMYFRQAQFKDCVRVTRDTAPAEVDAVCTRIGRHLDSVNRLADAEAFYLEAGMWREAVHVYISRRMWERAIAVGRTVGGEATKHVAYEYAKEMGGVAGARTLQTQGLLHDAVRRAGELGEFDFALSMASEVPELVREIRVARGKAMEDAGDYRMAEDEFLEAGAADEAVHMWANVKDFDRALLLADKHQVDASFVKRDKAVAASTVGRVDEAVALYIDLGEHDKALEEYTSRGLTRQALDLAQRHTELGRHVDRLAAAAPQRVQAQPAAAPTPARSAAGASIPAMIGDGQLAAVIERLTDADDADWHEANRAAGRVGGQTQAVIAYLFSKKLFSSDCIMEAVDLIADTEIPSGSVTAGVDYCLEVAAKVLGKEFAMLDGDMPSVDLQLYDAVVPKLDVILAKCVAIDGSGDVVRMYRAVRVEANRIRYSDSLPGLVSLAASAALSAMQFAGTVLPIDRALYYAATLCRAAAEALDESAPGHRFMTDMAVFTGNRLVDTAMFIGDPDMNEMPNAADLMDAGIAWPHVEVDVTVPFVDALSEEIEDMQTFTCDSSLDPALNTPESYQTLVCQTCGADNFVLNTICADDSCGVEMPQSDLTGAPLARETTTCPGCGAIGLQTEWNELAGQSQGCPMCGSVVSGRR